MFGFFYLETPGKQFWGQYRFESQEDAVAWFRGRFTTWEELKPAYERDKAVFLETDTGTFIVLREIGNTDS